MGRKSRSKRFKVLQPNVRKQDFSKKRSTFFKKFLLEIKTTISLLKDSPKTVKISIAVGLIFFGCSIIINSLNNKRLNGKVVFDGPIAISYSTNQIPDSTQDRISPICGCLIRRPHHGVMFFGNHYEIEVKKEKTETNFLHFQITSPYHHMDINPDFQFDCTILKINKDDVYKLTNFLNEHPDSLESVLDSNILRKQLKVEYYSQKKDISYFAFLDTARKVDFYHIGKFPISALIPMKNSEIRINKFRDTYRHTYDAISISEKFNSKDNNEFMNMPMLDVLGAYNLLVGNCEYIRVNDTISKMKRESNSVFCFILKSGLSNRISFNELTEKNVESLYEHPTASIYSKQSGEFTINIPNAFSDEEFNIMKKEMPKFYEKKLPEATTSSGKYVVSMLAPPSLEEYNGIYFYGHNLKMLQCIETYGSIQFGDKQFTLDPFRNIKMSNLKDFNFYDEPVILPLNYDPKSDLQTKFRGAGELYIDDEFAGDSFWDNPLLERLSFFLGILSSILGLFPLIKNFKLHYSEKYQAISNTKPIR